MDKLIEIKNLKKYFPLDKGLLAQGLFNGWQQSSTNHVRPIKNEKQEMSLLCNNINKLCNILNIVN